jgi:hypothetical protein
MRLAYRELFSMMKSMASDISSFLERNLVRYKISVRTSPKKKYELGTETRHLLSGPTDEGF